MKNNSEDQKFIHWLSSPIPELNKYINHFSSKNSFDNIRIEGQSFENLDLSLKSIDGIDFIDCKFNNCELESTWFSYAYLDNVVFYDCTIEYTKFTTSEFRNCSFINCTIIGLEIASSESYETTFSQCPEVLDLNIRAGRKNVYKFLNCFVAFLNIESYFFETPLNCNLIFEQCYIEKSNFKHLNLESSIISNCLISFNSFALCILSCNTLKKENKIDEKKYNLIDFRTLLESEKQDSKVLSDLFGIQNSDVKEYVVGLTAKIEFHTIFISYSFKDKKIAQRINIDLQNRGIVTFLWEKDAPAGKSLKDIMDTNINEKDKVLFISSENSIKSEACQFELSEARKKTNKDWVIILYPIHIDNYLFEVKKHQIKPSVMRDEYWENLEELKSVNSIDFSNCFDKNLKPMEEYDKALLKLVDGLKK